MNSNVWRLEAWLLGQSNINQQVNLARVTFRGVLCCPALTNHHQFCLIQGPHGRWVCGISYSS